MKITNRQLLVIEDIYQKKFELDLVAHLKMFSPKHTEIIGDNELSKVVRLGVDSASKYGFTNVGPTRFFLEMMFLFGSSFDTDIQLRWASTTLTRSDIDDQMDRADLLYDYMVEYNEKVYGPKNEYYLDALQLLKEFKIETFQTSKERYFNDAISVLKSIFPSKCEYLSDDLLSIIIRRGSEIANYSLIKSDQGKFLFVLLFFILGHGFANDPLYPWISQVLNEDSHFDAEQKVDRIFSKTKIFLVRTLMNAGGRNS